MKTVGRLLNINKGTIKNILYRYNKTGSISSGKIGGYKKKLINEEMGDALLAEIDKHPDITLEEMKMLLSEKNCNVSCGTISNFLKNKFYTFKKLKYSNVEKNSDRVKELRREYATNMLRNSVRSKQCVYIDETYCNIWTQKLKGRAARGQSAYLQVPSQRGPNISILMAIGKKGPIHFEVREGSVTQPIYQKFICDLSIILKAELHYLIHDNASIHNNVLTTADCHKIWNLPPYSPFLNPIENYFSKIKSKLRKKLTSFDFTSNNSKFQIIKNAIGEIMASEKEVDLSDYYRHTRTFYPSCLMLENIF